MSKINAVTAFLILSITGSALAGSFMHPVFGQEAFTAELSGDEELPPVNTDANGTINIQGDNQGLNYQLAVSDITNVTAAHIHFGNGDENGKVVVTLFESGDPSGLEVETLAGNFAGDDVQGPLVGLPLDQLMGFMGNGTTYVNVHSAEFPLGELRGQIEEQDVDTEEEEEEE